MMQWNVFHPCLWYMNVMDACKLINRLDEEDKSLITGDNEIFDCCRGRWILDRCWGFQKIFDYWRWEILADCLGIKDLWLFEKEKSLDHCWRLKILSDLWGLTRALTTSTGNENPSWLSWEIRKTLVISTGDQTKENLDFLENKEGSDGFCEELENENLHSAGDSKFWQIHAGE